MRAAEQRLGLLRRQAVRRGEIVDRKLMLLFALIEQAAVVTAPPHYEDRGVIALSNSASASSVFPDSRQRLAARRVWPAARRRRSCSGATRRWSPVSCAGSSCSDAGDSDPRSNEQPHERDRDATAIGADARAGHAKLRKKAWETGRAIDAEHSRG